MKAEAAVRLRPERVARPAQKRKAAPSSERRASKAPSLRDAAYEEIKRRIITCVFKPGEYINEAYVSGLLGIGRTPVHQAIDRLMLEGLTEIIPRKGVIVKPISLDEVLQVTEVRLVNECHCVRLAAERADAREIKNIEGILRRSKSSVSERDVEQLMLLDREFHLALANASRNNVLRELLTRLHDRSLRFWFISLKAPGHHLAVQQQHEAVLAAVRDGDGNGAEAAMRAHIEAFRHNFTQFI